MAAPISTIGVDDANLPPVIRDSADQIARMPGVNRVVLLPDCHLKQKYLETPYKANVPSSSVIASDLDAYYPQIRSRGMGCGMMAIGTGLRLSDIPGGEEGASAILGKYLTNRNHAGGARGKGRASFELTPDDLRSMTLTGAPWVAREFCVDDPNLRASFEGGSYLSEEEAEKIDWAHFSPDWFEGRIRAGKKIGLDLYGNHFLEAQVVDSTPASEANPRLAEGELAFVYHGSCNGMKSILVDQEIERLVEAKEFNRFTPEDWEYDRAMLATKMLLNWSAAARFLVFARIRSLLASACPDRSLDRFRLVTESPHNLVSIEKVDGKDQIVYRHNSVPTPAGLPVYVSGRNDFYSYLFESGETPEESLYSLDHGIGNLLKSDDDSAREADRTAVRLTKQEWRRFSLGAKAEETALLRDEGVGARFIESYRGSRLVQPDPYRLRPLATLKQRQIPLRPAWLKRGGG